MDRQEFFKKLGWSAPYVYNTLTRENEYIYIQKEKIEVRHCDIENQILRSRIDKSRSNPKYKELASTFNPKIFDSRTTSYRHCNRS